MSNGFSNNTFDHPQFNAEPRLTPLRQTEADLHNELLYIRFYRSLSQQDQLRFRARVRRFVADKLIVGVKNVYLPDNMRSFIAASAVQLTFGLNDWMLDHFHTIRIYPKEFYSRIYERNLKGGTSQNGVIWFSWKDYLAGYADQENGLNLGLHEMAHALMVNMQEDHMDARFVASFAQLTQIEERVMQKVRSGEVRFLRSYAGTNISEFFAVSVEHFFEQPQEFARQLPELYRALSDLLQQDPAGLQNHSTPIVAQEQPVPMAYTEAPEKPKRRLKDFRFAGWHWSLSMLLYGIFLTPVPLIFLCKMTLVNGALLWFLYFVFAIAGGFLFYRQVVGTRALGQTQYVMFVLFGFAPVALCGTLFLNRITPFFQEDEVYYLTGHVSPYNGEVAAELIGNYYKDMPELRELPGFDYKQLHPGTRLLMHFKRGIFGMRFHDYNELIE